MLCGIVLSMHFICILSDPLHVCKQRIGLIIVFKSLNDLFLNRYLSTLPNSKSQFYVHMHLNCDSIGCILFWGFFCYVLFHILVLTLL